MRLLSGDPAAGYYMAVRAGYMFSHHAIRSDMNDDWSAANE